MPPDSPAPVRAVHVLGGREMGGILTYLMTLARGSASHRVNLHALVLSQAQTGARLREAGVPVSELPRRRRGDFMAVVRAARLLRELRADVVHTHSVTSNFYGRLAARLARVPAVVTTVHGFVPDILRHNRAVPRPLLGPICRADLAMSRCSDRVISVSEEITAKLVSWGMDRRRVVTIPNGIDLPPLDGGSAARAAVREELGLRQDHFVIGSVGALSPLKDHALLLRAAAEFAPECPSVRLLLVGEGPERPRLEALARALGLAERTVFAGWRGDVPRLLPAMDVFALPSRTEGMPMALLEAMAAGCSVVATRVGGVPRLVTDGETGLLVPPQDAATLAQALLSLLRRPETRARLAAGGQARVQRDYSSEAMASRLFGLYRDLLAGTRHA